MADTVDQAQDYQEHDVNIALQNILQHKQVKPSNGICEDCGDPIPIERVRLINATTCIECATAAERRDKLWR